jgi:hypothetical protein
VRVDRFSGLSHAGASNRVEIVVDSGYCDVNARSGRCEFEVVAGIGIRTEYFSRVRNFEIFGWATELRQTDGFQLEERLRRIGRVAFIMVSPPGHGALSGKYDDDSQSSCSAAMRRYRKAWCASPKSPVPAKLSLSFWSSSPAG